MNNFEKAHNIDNSHIAWLLTSAFFYWQSPMKSFSKLFPQTTVFTSRWHGFAPGLEDSFRVQIVGKRKVISLSKSSTGYGNNFTYLPLKIIIHLLRFKPQVIFSNAFGVWTLLVLLFKPIGKWHIVIAHEGSSPSVDYRNSPLRLWLRRAMVKAADACITNAHAGKNYLTKILYAPENHVFVHPYEVPAVSSLVGNHQPTQSNSSLSHHPIFLFVGSLIPRKGLHLLLEACFILRKQGYDNYTLRVVGDGEQRQELEAFSQGHYLSNCVEWVGQVDYHQVGSYFQQADVFILPTLEDTWAVVVLEAMALGKPVLCSQWAGASELISNGETGYCFDPHYPQQLADLMCQFIDHPSLATEMGRKAEQVMSQYTPEAAGQFFSRVAHFVLNQ